MSALWWTSYAVLWVLTLTVAAVLVSVLRNLGTVYAMLEGRVPAATSQPRSTLKAGDILPGVTWEALSGARKVVPEPTGARQAFVVVSASCGPCAEYLRHLGQEPGRVDPLDPAVDDWTIVSISGADETLGLLRRAGVTDNSRVVLDPRAAVLREWGLAGTPSTVIVDGELRVVRQAFGSERHSEGPAPAAQSVAGGTEMAWTGEPGR